MILRPTTTTTTTTTRVLTHLLTSARSTTLSTPIYSRAPNLLAPALAPARRHLHQRMPAPPVPAPTPFVPDHATFLTLIGRQLGQHASKIPSWEALFTLRSRQLRELGVEPARARRYLLRWRDRFRQGAYGIGGELAHVVDGRAEVRVVSVPSASLGDGSKMDSAVVVAGDGGGGGEGPGGDGLKVSERQHATATKTAGMKKVIVNLPPGTGVGEVALEDGGKMMAVKGMKIQGAHTIVGPHVLPVKGTGGRVARIEIKEGLWEVRRGHKVDGGERRRAEVRSKRRAEERKNSR